MGAQDSLSLAEDFVDKTGTNSLAMIWDESFSSWQYYGIQAQPSAVLVDRFGEPIQGWLGAFDLNEVLELARAA